MLAGDERVLTAEVIPAGRRAACAWGGAPGGLAGRRRACDRRPATRPDQLLRRADRADRAALLDLSLCAGPDRRGDHRCGDRDRGVRGRPCRVAARTDRARRGPDGDRDHDRLPGGVGAVRAPRPAVVLRGADHQFPDDQPTHGDDRQRDRARHPRQPSRSVREPYRAGGVPQQRIAGVVVRLHLLAAIDPPATGAGTHGDP